MSDAAADEARLQEYAIALADAIDAALPRWVERCVTSRVTLDSATVSLVREVAARAHVEVGTRVRALLLLSFALGFGFLFVAIQQIREYAHQIYERTHGLSSNACYRCV